MKSAVVVAVVLNTAAALASLTAITTKGNAFFSGSDRFYIRGIDYQPGGSSQLSDPLADPAICNRDISWFKKLGLNTVRVYTVDNSKNHDECMNALAAAGIYLALDVNSPLYSLNQDNPGPTYNPTYLQNVFATIDAFQSYSNTLLFFSGNEVINAINNTNAAPFVKAVTRDMKQYIGERGYRAIPVGYSAADVSQNQYSMAQYMDCGSDPSRGDFYAINNYEWCDPSSFTTSGWNILAEQYKNYSLPVFMSEYGCIKPGPRVFTETTALYQPDMTVSFSGGLVYEYSQEASGFGIVTVNGNNVSPVGSQFTDLTNALAKGQPPSGSGGYTTSNGPQPCPGQSHDWDTSPFTGEALPATPSGALQYFKKGAGPGAGFAGKGSQWAAGGSTATASANAGAVTQTGSSSAAPLRLEYAQLVPLMLAGVTVTLSFVLGAAIF